MRNFLLVVIAAAALYLATLVVLSQRPGELGLVGGALRPCSGAGCWNSQIGPQETRVEPIYRGPDSKLCWQALQWMTTQNAHLHLGAVEGTWMAIEWRGTPIPIKADLEFLWMPDSGIVHVRSQNRLGSWGLGEHTDALAYLRDVLPTAMADLDADLH